MTRFNIPPLRAALLLFVAACFAVTAAQAQTASFGMNKGASILPYGLGGVRVTMTHADHSSELLWRNPATDKDETHVGGEPCSLVIEFENGFRIWRVGDTGLFGDLRLIGEVVKPDLLLIPIVGGRFVMRSPQAKAEMSDGPQG